MNTTLLSTALPTNYIDAFTMALYYLLFTATVCLFVDLSPLQKHPMCKLNYVFAIGIAALPTFALFQLTSFSSLLVQHIVGVSAAAVASVAVSLTIQKLIPIDIDF